jgi:hypothetical protein
MMYFLFFFECTGGSGAVEEGGGVCDGCCEVWSGSVDTGPSLFEEKTEPKNFFIKELLA